VKLTQRPDLAWPVVAVVLMLAGVGMIFAGVSGGLAIGVITVGIAIVAIREIDRVCRRPAAHP
jgi:hypothetical protein